MKTLIRMKIKKFISLEFGQWRFLLAFFLLSTFVVIAQEKHAVQVKAFDQSMAPYANIALSINGNEFLTINTKGIAFTELTDKDLPVKNVRFKDEQLEAASWNYSRGVLEIIIRKKNYKDAHVVIKDENNLPVANLRVTYLGKKNSTITTDAEGRGVIPVPLGEAIATASQFSADGYSMIKVIAINNEHVLTVSRLQPRKTDTQSVIRVKPIVRSEQTVTTSPIQNFRAMDTIQSLMSFYQAFKNYDFKKLNTAQQHQIDSKFRELIVKSPQLAASVNSSERPSFVSRITDATFFGTDMKNIVEQAEYENKIFNQQRAVFDEKFRLINKKLSGGIIQLDDRSRRELLSELTLLQNSLIENESRFLKSQNDYRQLINNARDRFFEPSDLKTKLTLTERQRVSQERDYDQRLVFVIALVIMVLLFIAVVIYYSYALRKQKSALGSSRDELKWTNDNLEGLVSKRTRQLQASNRELDTFLHQAARDLRTPVQSIRGLCDIGEELSADQQHEILERVAATADGMNDLLKKISLLSEINQPSNFTAITLSKIIEKVQKAHGRFIKEKRIELTVRCHEYVVFHSYPVLVEAIIASLLENALYFSTLKKGTPRVELTAEIKDMSAIIYIRDNGIGIGDVVKDKLFDMFFKGSELSKGNGLGLYLVQRAVKTLEGKIKLDSVLGQFTEITVALPLKSKAEIKKDLPVEAEIEWR